MKLLNTGVYLLLIDEEAEIEEGMITLYENLNIVNENFKEVYSDSDCFMKHYNIKILAYLPLTKEAKELDLPLLPPFENNFDLKQEIIRWYHSNSGITLINDPFLNGIVDKVQSKQFSLADVKKAIEMAQTPIETGIGDYYPNTSEIIQSLSTQQLPVSFIPETEVDPTNPKNWYKAYPSGKYWEDDPTDHLYTKRKGILRYKTITNEQGKEVLVGTYKY